MYLQYDNKIMHWIKYNENEIHCMQLKIKNILRQYNTLEELPYVKLGKVLKTQTERKILKQEIQQF